MLEQCLSDQATVARLRAGPVGPYLESFVEDLVSHGYARPSVRSHLWLIGDLGRWLTGRRLAISDLDKATIDAFIDHRQCRRHRRRGDMAALGRLLDHLRAQGAAPRDEHVADHSPIDALATRYTEYLTAERGLTTATVVNYLPVFRRLVTPYVREQACRLVDLNASQVSAFVLHEARSMSPGRAKLMVTALRSTLRFLLEHGSISANLEVCVPCVPHYRLATIPKFLAPDDVDRVIRSCDRRTASGRRDTAILLLLARLGLRAGEVLALELDDICWRSGQITIRRSKAGLGDRLPLPAEVGAALARYLRRDRATAATRRVFLCLKAPRRGFAGPSSVSTIVRRALAGARVDSPVKGAHLLRHSLATHMLSRGASLGEIAQILRHRTTHTTEIYAKVDLAGLRALAQPWPTGGA